MSVLRVKQTSSKWLCLRRLAVRSRFLQTSSRARTRHRLFSDGTTRADPSWIIIRAVLRYARTGTARARAREQPTELSNERFETAALCLGALLALFGHGLGAGCVE